MVAAAKIVIAGTFPRGDIWQSTFHVDLDPLHSPLVESDASDISDQVDTFILAIAGTLWENGTLTEEVSVQDLNVAQASPWYFPAAFTPTGGTVMPQICALVLTQKNLSLPGASKRGRSYLPLTRQSALGAKGGVAGAARQTLLTAFADFAVNLRTNTVSEGFVTYSRKLGIVTPVNIASVDNNIATQRNRQDRTPTTTTTETITYGP